MKTDLPARSKIPLNSFMAELDHEIRSPLNTILNMAELALREDPGRPVKNYLKSIEKSANRLLALLDDIIELSGGEDKNREDASFYLTTVLEEVRENVESHRLSRAASIALEMKGELPECFQGFMARIRQVLTQILNFAIRQLHSRHVILSLKPRSHREGLDFEIEAFAASSGSWTEMDVEKDQRLAVCRALLSDTENGLKIEGTDQHLIFTFSIDTETVSTGRDRLFVPDFYREIPSALMVNSDGFSAQLMKRRLELEGIPVTIMPSLEKAAEYLAGDVSPHAGGKACYLNWEDVRNREDLGVGFLRSAAGMNHLPVIVVEIPAVEIMNLAVWRDFSGGGADTAVGLVMKPSGGRKILMETARVLGWNPEEILAEQPGGRESGTWETSKIFRGIKVLVVEDDRINQKILLDILKKRAIRPVVASTGSAALKAVERRKFDAVFMDINLPDHNGYELTEMIRKSAPNSKTPIIALTASTRNRRKCFDAGMNDFLAKPYSEGKILETLAKWVKASQQDDMGKDR